MHCQRIYIRKYRIHWEREREERIESLTSNIYTNSMVWRSFFSVLLKAFLFFIHFIRKNTWAHSTRWTNNFFFLPVKQNIQRNDLLFCTDTCVCVTLYDIKKQFWRQIDNFEDVFFFIKMNKKILNYKKTKWFLSWSCIVRWWEFLSKSKHITNYL